MAGCAREASRVPLGITGVDGTLKLKKGAS